jgi:uncharacterized protein YegL
LYCKELARFGKYHLFQRRLAASEPAQPAGITGMKILPPPYVYPNVAFLATTAHQNYRIVQYDKTYRRFVMNENVTEIVFILDRSGSMSGLENDTIGGFNGFVRKQVKAGQTNLTTILFDDKYEILHNGVDAKNISLSATEYYTRGSTALLDAIGKTINEVGRRLSETPEDKRPGKVIFVITTDGLENASREFSYDEVKKMITHQTEKYQWEFIFMGANIDVAKEGGKLGISIDRSFSFAASKVGVAKMFTSVAGICSSMRDSSSRGSASKGPALKKKVAARS